MITVYVTPCEPEEGNKKYVTQHQKGLSLLCRGLMEIYDLAMNPDKLPKLIGHEKYGKPFLINHENIHFNISHCDGLAVCAFSRSPVGLDVEGFLDFKDSLVRRVLTEEEQDFLFSYREDEEKYTELFCRFWTLKESYLKRDGSGFHKDPREVSFAMELTQERSRIFCSDRQVHFFQKKICANTILSVCSEGVMLEDNMNIRWI